MLKHWKITVPVLALALLAGCSGGGSLDRTTRQLLGELDGYVSARDVYVARKLDQLDAMRRLAASTADPRLRYGTEMNLADEYFAFNFDSTQHYLKHCQEIAEVRLKDRERFDRASIKLGHLYAKAGSYMEAYRLLYEQIDTTTLTEELKTDYLLTLYDFSMDLAGNSGMVERLNIADAASFRPALYARIPKDSETWRSILRDDLFAQGRFAQADSVGHLLLAGTRPEEHAYAIYAFYLSDIADRMGRSSDRMAWLIRSAESDIINAVKDYASLTMIAQNILSSDVDRSFRYLRIAQEDAIYYNAKLRPWQISRFLIQVQDAYSERHVRMKKMTDMAAILLAVLVLALSVVSWFYLARSRKLSQIQGSLEESNARLTAANEALNRLNQEISTADQVKERFIVSFLESFSGQIHLFRSEDNRIRNLVKRGRADLLLKDTAFSKRSEKAREEFYNTFDTTFLAMYPDFVEGFNSLLREEARVYPPEGKLNTELRIFALIRLGVDDSKRIASMLDYSLSTIYNYKVSVKNSAAVDRDSFEDLVKAIGK
ncbi:MAG: DUF6377 domain-containing protein [Bacteroidales bacterium]|nr:DUF6377 domain-containing protein [Bacteroidales bacterium]